MKFCSNCGSELSNNETHCVNCGLCIKKDMNYNKGYFDTGDTYDIKKLEKSEKNAKISLILALIPIALICYCLVVSHGETSEAGDGAIWWLLILYYLSIGFPIAITSLILGITSYKTQKNKLALWSIVIDILPFMCLIFLS